MATDREDLADLRRRVYGPDATDEDRRRYRDALGAPVATAEPAPVAASPSAPPPPRRRILLAAAGTLAVAAAVTVGTLVLRPATPPGPAPGQLPLTADERGEFANALVIGTDAGIAAYLTSSRPKELTGATFADTVEDRGVGPADVVVLQDAGTSAAVVIDGRTGQTVVPEHGRATVLLVTAQGATVGWTLESGLGSNPRVVARRGGYQAAGALTSATIAYATGARPDHLRIDVPSGVPWGAAVVYSD